MSVLKLEEENFEEEVLESDKKVLVDFYADWCGPCKMISPLIEEVAKEKNNIKFVRVDVDKNEQLASKYNVMYIPTLIVFENGKETNKSVGYIDKDAIIELIK